MRQYRGPGQDGRKACYTLPAKPAPAFFTEISTVISCIAAAIVHLEKMKTVEVALFMASIWMFAACSSPHSIMQSWVGQDDEQLYARWGNPTKTIDNGASGKIAVYIGAEEGKQEKSNYCDFKFKSACIPPKMKEYRKAKLFYITPMGHIYNWKIVAAGKMGE